jgi:hypothetical protein
MTTKPFVLLLLLSFASYHCKKHMPEDEPIQPFDPKTIEDCNYYLTGGIYTQAVPELSSMDHIINDSATRHILLSPIDFKAYYWDRNIFKGIADVDDWEVPYRRIRDYNFITDKMNTIPVTDSNRVQWNYLHGRVLFLRSYALLNLVQVFATYYNSATAANTPGIPLDGYQITKKSYRTNLQAIYDMITDSLQASIPLLPMLIATTDTYRSIPTKQAAYALLARLYLNIADYPKAGVYADSSLKIYSQLINYNQLDTLQNLTKYFPANPEILLNSTFPSTGFQQLRDTTSYITVNPDLYNLYAANDLRRTVCYYRTGEGTYHLRNSPYSDYSTNFFTGLTTAEMYLIRAEAAARAGMVNEALQDLNILLAQRYKTGSFAPVNVYSATEAIQVILQERRKELAFRGLYWQDIKRLNAAGAGIKLQRVFRSTTYVLEPNSPLYTFPFPDSAILNSTMQQNPR